MIFLGTQGFSARREGRYQIVEPKQAAGVKNGSVYSISLPLLSAYMNFASNLKLYLFKVRGVNN